MAIGPLFVKYQTRAGNCYVYDPRTNEVIRVEEAIYQILDDYHVLDQDEIIAKNQANGEAVVRMALAQLDALQSSGILCDHPPQLTRRAEWIRCQGTTESLDEFLRHRRRLLTLELTQQCNLRCDYCCFGEHYPQTRRPSTSPMSFETARKAVTAFINHRPKRAGIGFYGGEPLLEFDLLKQIVLFAEEQAGQFATSVGFSITTNGTLLTDEKIHFLAQHEFSVLVSLDGDKKSHDRYRIFRNQNRPEKRIGSFDTVIKNMTRFVELYPEYLGRDRSYAHRNLRLPGYRAVREQVGAFLSNDNGKLRSGSPRRPSCGVWRPLYPVRPIANRPLRERFLWKRTTSGG